MQPRQRPSETSRQPSHAASKLRTVCRRAAGRCRPGQSHRRRPPHRTLISNCGPLLPRLLPYKWPSCQTATTSLQLQRSDEALVDSHQLHPVGPGNQAIRRAPVIWPGLLRFSATAGTTGRRHRAIGQRSREDGRRSGQPADCVDELGDITTIGGDEAEGENHGKRDAGTQQPTCIGSLGRDPTKGTHVPRPLVTLLLRGSRDRGPALDSPRFTQLGAAETRAIATTRERLDHEHELMNARVAQLLTLDGLLGTAISFVWSSRTLSPGWLLIPAAFGAIVSLSYWYAIELASMASDQYRRHAAKLLSTEKEEIEPTDPAFRMLIGQPLTPLHDVRPHLRRWLQPHRAVPAASAVTWIAVGIGAAVAWAT